MEHCEEPSERKRRTQAGRRFKLRAASPCPAWSSSRAELERLRHRAKLPPAKRKYSLHRPWCAKRKVGLWLHNYRTDMTVFFIHMQAEHGVIWRERHSVREAVLHELRPADNLRHNGVAAMSGVTPAFCEAVADMAATVARDASENHRERENTSARADTLECVHMSHPGGTTGQGRGVDLAVHRARLMLTIRRPLPPSLAGGRATEIDPIDSEFQGDEAR